MRHLKRVLLVGMVGACISGCGAAGNSGSPTVPAPTTGGSVAPSTTSMHSQKIMLLVLSDMPAGWVDIPCGGVQDNQQACSKPKPVADGRPLGEAGFQNSVGTGTQAIAEELFSFSSEAVARTDTSSPRILLGARLARALAAMSFPGVKADQVAGFTSRTGTFREDYIFVRDGAEVGVFACVGVSLAVELSTIQDVT